MRFIIKNILVKSKILLITRNGEKEIISKSNIQKQSWSKGYCFRINGFASRQV